MRITDKEREAFISVISKYVASPSELRLFGSRVDDNALGGDFDLLIIVEEVSRETLSANKAEILSQIKETIGEQKIDLLIATPESVNKSAFVKTILPGSVCLKRWK